MIGKQIPAWETWAISLVLQGHGIFNSVQGECDEQCEYSGEVNLWMYHCLCAFFNKHCVQFKKFHLLCIFPFIFETLKHQDLKGKLHPPDIPKMWFWMLIMIKTKGNLHRWEHLLCFYLPMLAIKYKNALYLAIYSSGLPLVNKVRGIKYRVTLSRQKIKHQLHPQDWDNAKTTSYTFWKILPQNREAFNG